MVNFFGRDNYERARTCIVRARTTLYDMQHATDRGAFYLYWENFLNFANKARKQVSQFENLHLGAIGNSSEICLSNQLREKQVLDYLIQARNAAEHGTIEVSETFVSRVAFGGPERTAFQMVGKGKVAMGDCVIHNQTPDGKVEWGLIQVATFSNNCTELKIKSNISEFSVTEFTVDLLDVVNRNVTYEAPRKPSGEKFCWDEVANGVLEVLEKKLERALTAALYAQK